MYKDVVKFIRDLYNDPSGFIPLHVPTFNGNEKKYLLETIDSTFVSSVGAYVDQFELQMQELTGAKYAIATVNGTAALHIAIKLAGVEEGDEVLTQALTFVATTNALSYEKATPHFVDVDMNTLGLSPDSLRQRLEEIAEMKNGNCYNKKTGKRIKACIPMHTFGFPARIDEILTICDKYNINVIEDAAESLGSYYKNKHTGTFGLLGTFSFNGNKTITCGGGGAIVTNDEKIAKLAKHITTTAKIPHKWEYVHDQTGYNYRMPNLNAALACAQLEQLKSFVENKRETAKAYKEFFENYKGVSHIKEPKDSYSNYWLNAVQLNNRTERDDFLSLLNDNGVMSRPIWTLMYKLKMFQNAPKGDMSNSEILESTVGNIPSSVRI